MYNTLPEISVPVSHRFKGSVHKTLPKINVLLSNLVSVHNTLLAINVHISDYFLISVYDTLPKTYVPITNGFIAYI